MLGGGGVWKNITASLDGRITTLENIKVRSTRFALIASGTGGTITLPPISTVVPDDFGGLADAVISKVTSSRPTFESALTSGGDVVTTTFDSGGNYTLSDTPSPYPVAIIYRVEQDLKDFDSTATDILGDPEYIDYVKKSGDIMTGTLIHNVSADHQIFQNGSGVEIGRITRQTGLNKLQILSGVTSASANLVLDAAGESSSGGARIRLSQYNETVAGNASTNILLRKYRGTIASPAANNDNDRIGALSFAGYDGSNDQFSADYTAWVDGTPSSGNVPLRLELNSGSNAAGKKSVIQARADGRVQLGFVTPGTAISSDTSKLYVKSLGASNVIQTLDLDASQASDVFRIDQSASTLYSITKDMYQKWGTLNIAVGGSGNSNYITNYGSGITYSATSSDQTGIIGAFNGDIVYSGSQSYSDLRHFRTTALITASGTSTQATGAEYSVRISASAARATRLTVMRAFTELYNTAGVTNEVTLMESYLGDTLAGASINEITHFKITANTINSAYNHWYSLKNIYDAKMYHLGNVALGGSSAYDAGAKLEIRSTDNAQVSLKLKQKSGQTASLFEMRDSSDAIMSRFNKDGWLGIGANPSVRLDIRSSSSADELAYFLNNATRGIMIGVDNTVGYNSTASSDTEYRIGINGTSNYRFAIKTGTVFVNLGDTTASIDGLVGVANLNAATKAFVVRGFTSQSASLQEWQNVGGTVLSLVDADGSIGVNTTSIHASAVLQADSDEKGFLPPRMDEDRKNSISSPAIGLIVYQTDATEGLYVYTSGGWVLL